MDKFVRLTGLIQVKKGALSREHSINATPDKLSDAENTNPADVEDVEEGGVEVTETVGAVPSFRKSRVELVFVEF